MRKKRKTSAVKKGSSAGSLDFIGEKKVQQTRIELFSYNASELKTESIQHLSTLDACTNPNLNYWLNVDGIHDVATIQAIGQKFGIHKLALEDLLNTNQRPKVEEYENFLFVTLKMIWFDHQSNEMDSEQFSLCLFENILITFQERTGDVFDNVRSRLTVPSSRGRNFGPDYLCYSLLDNLVDNYLLISEQVGIKIEELEDNLLQISGHMQETRFIKRLNEYKQEVNFLRKNLRPAHEIVLKLVKTTNPLIKTENKIYLKDLCDLSSLANENTEVYREMLSDQLMIFQANVGNKLNQVMKILTVFSAIFIPLTFITGVYGTNFDNIPELHYQNGFYIFLVFLVFIGILTFWYFKKNKWL